MKRKLLLLFFALGMGYVGWGQVSLTSTGTAFTQNFNTLANSGTTNVWTDNSTITGWYTNRVVYIGDDGSNTTGGLHSYGTTLTAERAIGALTSGGVATAYIGVRLVNNSGAAMSSFDVAYRGEQWRQTANAQSLVFEFQVGATSLTTGTWTPITALDFTAPKTGTAGPLDGNVSGNYANKSATITVSVNNTQEIWFRWTKSSSTSPGLGVDDFSVTGTASSNTAPTVTTQAVSSIGTTTATGNGTITATGGANATARGVCWDVFANPVPDINDSHSTESGDFGNGAFTGSIISVSAETRYQVVAYATNTVGTGYGSAVNFWTLSLEPSAHSTTFTNSVISQTQIDLSFDAASSITNADGYIILQKTGSAPTGSPTDGAGYSVGNTIGDGTVAALVTSTSSTSASINGLSAGTNYYFTIMPFNWNGTDAGTYNYNTNATIPGTNGTTSPPNDADSYVNAPGAQSNPVTISSLTDTDPEAVEVFKFKINDAGIDGLLTKVTQVTIKTGTNNTANWSNTILGAKLSTDGGSTFVTTGTVTISASSIVFPVSVGNLDISNGSNATISLFIYLKSSGLTDNQVLEFTIPTTSHGFTADATGSTFLTTFVSPTTSNQMTINVVATKFNFSTQPANTTVNTNFSAAVEALDANNNRDLNATTSVTLSASAGTLSSVTGLTQNLATGVYSWTDLQNNTAGTGVTLDATGTLTTATSNAFRILSAEPASQATAILFSNVGINSMTVSWTNGAGTNRIVVVKAAGTPGTPTDGSTYSANSEYGLGGTIAANEFVLYSGTGSTVDVTGLTGSTTYTFKVFEFNGGSGTENYLTTSNATSQTTTALTYYSNGSVDPATFTNWKTNRDGSGSSPANFTTGEVFVIESGDNMTTTAPWSISGTNSKLWIENGGTLTANNAITLAVATTFQIDNGGTYIHNNTTAFGTSIFQGTESFGNNSTVEYKDWNSTGPSVSAWGNVKFNATGAVAGSIQFSGAMTTINGNMEVIATGSTPRDIRLATTQAPTITIKGFYSQSAGTVNLATTSGITVFNVEGNFIINGGTFTSTSTGSKVVFNGSSAQTFTNAGTISTVNFEVGGSSILNMGTQVLTGGSFTLPAGATLRTGHVSGINGSITATTKTLNSGANYTFDGSSAQVTGALLPATVNNFTIDNAAGVTLSNSALTVNGTMLINASKLFTLGVGKQLTIAGTLTNSAGNTGLVIASDATGSGSLIHSTAGVAGTVNRYIAALNDAIHGWHFLSSPVSAQAISVFHTENSGDDFYKWEEATNLWINRTATGGGLNGSFETNFGVGTGYLMANALTTTPAFTGNLNVADVTISGLAKAASGFHLLGNPFSSALVWDKTGGSWALLNIATSCQLWNEANASYSVISANGIIPANNGFMVYTTGSGSLTIPASARTHDATNWYKQTETTEGQIKLLATDIEGQTAQETIISFNDNATESFDMMHDAYFMAGYAPMFYSVSNNEIYALNCLPVLNEQTTIPVGFVKNSGSNFSIELTQNIAGLIVYLTDLKTNQTQNLCEGKYHFTSANGDEANRFTVHFGALGINETPTNHLNAYVSNNNLYVTNESGNAQLQIFDLQGRMIETINVTDKGLISLPIQLKSGAYVVRMISETSVKSVKIVISE